MPEIPAASGRTPAPLTQLAERIAAGAYVVDLQGVAEAVLRRHGTCHLQTAPSARFTRGVRTRAVLVGRTPRR